MAEKEERILIGTDIESPCVKCKEIDFCDGNCEQYEKFAEEFKPGALKVLYRQETIERMAKAICNMGDEENWERVDDNYKHYCTAQAEWALNALLEEK